MLTVDDAIYATLTGDTALMALATGGVWPHKAPKGTSFPIVVYTPMPLSPDLYTFGARVWTEVSIDVKAIVEGHVKTVAQQIADRIDTLLNDQRNIVAGGKGMYLRRHGVIDYAEETLGRDFLHLGGQYVVCVAP